MLKLSMTKEIHENPKYIEKILFMFRKYTMKSADEPLLLEPQPIKRPKKKTERAPWQFKVI